MKSLLFLALFFAVFAVTLAEDDTETGDVTIVSRSEWQATRPRHPAAKQSTLPPRYAIISHTASGACRTKYNCMRHLQNIQVMHMKQWGWDDIGYNFMVGGDGNVYEGRGWDVEGAHTKSWNGKSLGIALVGDFRYSEPTQPQLDALKSFLELAVQQKKLAEDYKLLGQRQVVATESPGSKVYEVIKTWEHWTDSP